MKKALAAASLFTLICLIFSGCRSAFVSATITNKSAAQVTLIEVDYPSASFGVGSLAGGAQYHYRFKILGNGPVKIQYTDASGKEHTASGPDLQEGQQGTLQINIDASGKVSWIPSLAGAR